MKKWKALSRKERLGKRSRSSGKPAGSLYPEDGLALSLVLRKLYSRKPAGRSARGVVEWNQDFAWFTASEARHFLGSRPKKGGTHDLPDALIQRLARFHFTDTVRVFSDPYPKRCVQKADLRSTVLSVTKSLVSLRFDGAVQSSQENLPRFGTSNDQARIPRREQRHFKATLLGYATFDLKKRKFTTFELVAFGEHSGGGMRSFEDPVAMGVAMTLAKDTPLERVEPRHLAEYGWR